MNWASARARSRSRPFGRVLWLALVLFPALGVAGIWLAIRTLPWFGPELADGLRRMVGASAVTTMEEVSAGVEDRLRLAVGDAEPRGLSEATPVEIGTLSRNASEPLAGSARPRDIGPMFHATASPEDGLWQAVPVASTLGSPLYRTLVHPDPRRAYAELFVFAMDLSQFELHFVAGSVEPEATREVGERVKRSGRIPETDAASLIAAFNGGFKTEHGHYGMMVDGLEISPPIAKSCTVAAGADGSLFIGTWSSLSRRSLSLVSWRQTPACMAEGGTLHPGLRGDSTNWGATIAGNTVIRRSAIGLDRDHTTLFVGISNATTARALAIGMLHIGAIDVAQLDVNHSFPKFVLYGREPAGALTAISAVKGFAIEPGIYVRRPSTRDFFYVTTRRR